MPVFRPVMPTLDENKRNVMTFYDLMFNQNKPGEAIERFADSGNEMDICLDPRRAPTYPQHGRGSGHLSPTDELPRVDSDPAMNADLEPAARIHQRRSRTGAPVVREEPRGSGPDGDSPSRG